MPSECVRIVGIDDTRRNLRRLLELGGQPLSGHRCSGCRCSILVAPSTVAIDPALRELFCIRCSRARSAPDTRAAGLTGGEHLFTPDAVAEILERPLHDLLDAAARNSMGAG